MRPGVSALERELPECEAGSRCAGSDGRGASASSSSSSLGRLDVLEAAGRLSIEGWRRRVLWAGASVRHSGKSWTCAFGPKRRPWLDATHSPGLSPEVQDIKYEAATPPRPSPAPARAPSAATGRRDHCQLVSARASQVRVRGACSSGSVHTGGLYLTRSMGTAS